MRNYLIFCILILSVFLNASSNAQEIKIPNAPPAKGPQPAVTTWNGSYTTTIDVDLPEFRGLAPNLKLTYDSTRGMRGLSDPGGNLALGWRLSGLSFIQRTAGNPPPALGVEPRSGARGVPGYVPNDGFTLDGVELVMCGYVVNVASAPSCKPQEATEPQEAADRVPYATRLESFQRVRYLSLLGQWEVTAKNGARTIYASFEGADPFRWHVSRVEDRRGNFVTYSWTCNASKHCAIASIAYFNVNSTTPVSRIVFGYEVRPDIASYGSGKNLRLVETRLSRIDVENAGVVARSYLLAYDVEPSRNVSLLKTVNELGRSMVNPATGVAEQLAIPPTELTYDIVTQPPAPVQLAWAKPSQGTKPGFGYRSATGGDYNGDNIPNDNIVTNHVQDTSGGNNPQSLCAFYGQFATAAGAFSPPVQSSTSSCASVEQDEFLNQRPPIPEGDFDGDGATDFGWVDMSSAGCTNSVANSTNNCPSSNSAIVKWNVNKVQNLATRARALHVAVAADVDGDGKDEFIRPRQGVVWFLRAGQLVSESWNGPQFPRLESRVIFFWASQKAYSGDRCQR